ncbi:MAG TPA: hypothetical protein VH183_01530 [Burkholderiaceae bacterium]|nr:hypothetical protein [Burkholderiaceae bacterium]
MLAFLLIFCALAGSAALLDALLRSFDVMWIGRYLGIPGALLILASFGYSLRKRKAIRFGRAAQWLRIHEGIAWLGSLLVLVHAGLQFKALLGWLAAGAMLINVVSGLTGKLLLGRSKRKLEQQRPPLREAAPSDRQIEERMYWDSLAFDVVKRWRVVHLPITVAFAILATAHIFAEILFWNWK